MDDKKMKRLALVITLTVPVLAMAAPHGWVNPLKFDGSDAMKTQVIEFIKKNVHKEYCEGIGQCSASVLRMMEQANLEDFKYLVQNAKSNETAFRQVYKDYCAGIGQCGYSTLKMMFVEENKNSKKELTW